MGSLEERLAQAKASEAVAELTQVAPAFEEQYLAVRRAEGRLYGDEAVRGLPHVVGTPELKEEWRVRAWSLERVLSLPRAPPRSVLDLGCGNGWLTHHLAERWPGARVLGLDVNRFELEQARRVFPAPGNLYFALGDVFQLGGAGFDLVTASSVIQYFPDLGELLRALRDLLNPQGAILIFDSPLYGPGAAEAARRRTRTHYEHLGFPEAANAYHHHTFADLEPFEPRFHFDPRLLSARLQSRLGRRLSPFPIMEIVRDG